MISNQREYEVAVWLRQQILDLIAGVNDAPELRWDDRSPNWLTRRAISNLTAELGRRLAELGVFTIREHAPCGSRHHETLASHSLLSSSNHWRLELPDGRADAHTVEDGVLYLDGVAMACTEPHANMAQLLEPCPCRPGKPVEHTIATYYAWPDTPETRLEVLNDCHRILNLARRRSEDNKPRSAIREHLLQCLILLNEAIAPVSAGEHILLNAPSSA